MRSGTSRPWRTPASDSPRTTVSLSAYDGEPLHPLRELHQPVGLLFADDVEGEQDVVGDAGIGEDLDLAELLAGDADSPGFHLHLPDRGDLVRLDVRPVAEPMRGDRRLRPRDVRFQAVEQDGDGRRV